jgi:hypothetical protein
MSDFLTSTRHHHLSLFSFFRFDCFGCKAQKCDYGYVKVVDVVEVVEESKTTTEYFMVALSLPLSVSLVDPQKSIQ